MNRLLSRPLQPFVALAAFASLLLNQALVVPSLRVLQVFDCRGSPLLPARVTTVSPDAVTDLASHQRRYLAQEAVAPQVLAEHPLLRLQAGMPADVSVAAPPRSLLRYLLEPLGLFARRALREP